MQGWNTYQTSGTDVEQASGPISLELKEEVRTRSVHLLVISIHTVLEAKKLGKCTGGNT